MLPLIRSRYSRLKDHACSMIIFERLVYGPCTLSIGGSLILSEANGLKVVGAGAGAGPGDPGEPGCPFWPG